MNKNTVLVTGANSQIGCFLLPRLQQAAYRIHVLGRCPPMQADVSFIPLDLSALSEELPLPAAPILFHLAGLPLLPDLLRRSELEIKRLVAFSSTSALSKRFSPDPAERAVAADLLKAEAEVREICNRRGIAWTLFRPTLVYGCQRDRNISFIAGFIHRFGFFPLVGAGGGLRMPVHADDLAAACLQVLSHPHTQGKIYTLSGAETLSYRNMVTAVFEMLGKKPRVLSLPPGLFRLLLGMFGKLPGFQHISPAMLERMNQDLCFEHAEAVRDFSYTPRGFRGNILDFSKK